MIEFTRASGWALIVGAALVGCRHTKEEELQNVARDWSLVIRASQVIPVYPLTEDLRPGDMYLVETPLQEKTQYEGDGYLRLDQHLDRLHGLDYMNFYQKSHGIKDETVKPPMHWQFPKNAAGEPRTGTDGVPLTAWSIAPRAAFPTYTFNVSKGAGASVALPVSGVPIGLSLMQTDSAHGSITLADAYTYGVSLHELRKKVADWAEAPHHRRLLKDIREAAGKAVYLRVVNRVYLTGRVIVSMSNTRVFEAAGKAGAAPEVTIPEPEPGERRGLMRENSGSSGAAETRAARIVKVEKARAKIVEDAVGIAAPGGAFRILQASSRTVSMSEKFGRPLVVGFLGFDFPVLVDGRLGAPLSTRARLGGDETPVRLRTLTDTQEDYIALRCLIDATAKKDEIHAAAAAALGDKFLKAYQESMESNKSSTRAFKAAKDATMTETSDAYDALLIEWGARRGSGR